jgi:prepilin-type N-terminal cleavage/methylation domain-containing protein
VSGTYKQGFTLLEILVAIVIIAIMATVVVPNLAPLRASEERTTFIAKLNTLMQFAWQDALITNTVYKVAFDFKHKTVSLEQATDQKDGEGKTKFVPLQGTYFATSLAWPRNLEIKNFFIEGFDEMKRFSGRDTGETWFFIVPDGLTQRVTINLIDTMDISPQGRPAKVGLVLNPFNARFTAYDTFKS